MSDSGAVVVAAHPTISSVEFRNVIGHFASGVTVISCTEDGEHHGATASAFTSLAAEPPMVLVCLNRSSRTAQAIVRQGTFGVNVLEEAQVRLAGLFAGRTEDKFADVEHVAGVTGDRLLSGSHAALTCAVESITSGGTHVVLLARVVTATPGTGRPLLYHRGAFGRFTTAADPLRGRRFDSVHVDPRFGMF